MLSEVAGEGDGDKSRFNDIIGVGLCMCCTRACAGQKGGPRAKP